MRGSCAGGQGHVADGCLELNYGRTAFVALVNAVS